MMECDITGKLFLVGKSSIKQISLQVPSGQYYLLIEYYKLVLIKWRAWYRPVLYENSPDLLNTLVCEQPDISFNKTTFYAQMTVWTVIFLSLKVRQ